jgi:hypothetical protein
LVEGTSAKSHGWLKGFVEVDRETPMLLPADLREWVPEEDLVHFVIEAVKTLPTREFVVNERGTG